MATGIIIGKHTKPIEISRTIAYLQEDEKDIFFVLDEIPHEYRLQTEKYACVMLYNVLYGFDGEIMFANPDDFNSCARTIKNNKISVIVDKDKLATLKPEFLRESQVLIYHNDKIRKAKNAELQPLLR